jgi:hypothetical protein
MSDPPDSANAEAPPGCPRCPSKSTTCLHSASPLGESPSGKARVWMKINGFLKFDYGCCKGCKYLVHECFGEAVFEGDRFEVDESLANKLADFGIALKIKDAPVRPMFDDPLAGIHSLTESQRACYAVLLTERLKQLPENLPEDEYNATTERIAREFAMEFAIPTPNPFEPPKPVLRRFGDHPAFERLVRFILPPDLTNEEFEEQKEWEAEREIPASAWPSESGGPVEQFRIVHLGDPSKVELARADAQSPVPASAAPSHGICKLVGLGGARAEAQSMYPWRAEAEKTRSINEQQVKEWMLQKQPERDEIEADPDVQRLQAEAQEIEAHYRPLLKAMEALWMQLTPDELRDAQVVQSAHAMKMDDLRRRYRNLIEERYDIPNLDDAIDRPSRFLAWLDHRTTGFLWWSGEFATELEKGMGSKGIEEAFAKAVEYAKAADLGPPPKPPVGITSRAEAEHYVLMLREWAVPRTDPMQKPGMFQGPDDPAIKRFVDAIEANRPATAGDVAKIVAKQAGAANADGKVAESADGNGSNDIFESSTEVISIVAWILANPLPPGALAKVSDTAAVKKKAAKLMKEWFEHLTAASDEAIHHCELLLEFAGPGIGTAMREWIKRLTTNHGREHNPHDKELLTEVVKEAMAISSLSRRFAGRNSTLAASTTGAQTHPATPVADVPDGFYSPNDIAKALKAPNKSDAIRMALKRLLDENRLPDGAWMENNNPAKGQAKILYKLSAVRPFLSRFEPPRKE